MGKLYYFDFTAIEWKGSDNSHVDIIIHNLSYTSGDKEKLKLQVKQTVNIFQNKIGMQLEGTTKINVRQPFSKEVSFNLL